MDLKVEYLVVTYKDKDPQVTLSLRQADILTALAQDEKLCTEGGCVPDLQDVDGYAIYVFLGQAISNFHRASTLPIFHPEFGRFMLEATPGKPWGIGFKDLLDVETNMRLR